MAVPVFVGVGQHVMRDQTAEAFTPPVDAMAIAVRAAVEDAECTGLLGSVDALHVVNVLTWQLRDAPSALSEAVGIQPALKEYTVPGGNTPQWLVNRAADNIAAGTSKCAIVAGCDLMSLVFKSMRRGQDVGAFSEGIDVPMAGEIRNGTEPYEDAHGVGMPSEMYPLLENALRYKQGLSLEQQRANLGRFAEEFSAVAAENPYAFLPEKRTADEAVNASAKNRMTAFPYTKYLSSCPADQSAAVIVCSTEEATRLGIPESKWVYLHGGQQGHDEWFVSHRPDLADSPAVRACVNDTLVQAGIGLEDISFFDLYSCFPVMPRLTCQALGIADDDPRPQTVTGGLCYFGGAGNNYTLHAIADTVQRCRKSPEGYGLVTANGYYATKHSVGLYSGRPSTCWSRMGAEEFQATIDLPEPLEVDLEPTGNLTVEGYTVAFGFDGTLDKGIVLGRTASGKRAWANVPREAADTLQAMTSEEWCGKTGRITGRKGGVNFVEF